MKGEPRPPDSWASGESYHQYVGRWSRLVAAEFIAWLDAPPQGQWLDIGCGTGALCETILDLSSPAGVKGIDPAESHVAFARIAVQDTRAAFSVGGAEDLHLPDESCDVVVSGLVLNFIPRIQRGISEMKRVTRQGGIVGAYVWDYAGKMELIRYFWDAASALDRTAIDLDEGRRFPLCQPGSLYELFSEAGFHNVEVRPVEVVTTFQSFDDYWLPFLGGQGPAPGYAMSLSEEGRTRLRDRIRSTLPIDADGSIGLRARAWAIKGTKRRHNPQ